MCVEVREESKKQSGPWREARASVLPAFAKASAGKPQTLAIEL